MMGYRPGNIIVEKCRVMKSSRKCEDVSAVGGNGVEWCRTLNAVSGDLGGNHECVG